MRIARHRVVLIIGAMLIALLLPSICFADFQVSLPSGTAVTMGDAVATLSFTVSLDATESKDIRTLFFNIDPNLYSFSASTVGPTCNGVTWVVQGNMTSCSQPECISLTVPTGANGIAPGDSCTFDIVVTGPNDGPFAADTQDINTDTLSDVVAAQDRGANQQRGDYTLSGGLPVWDRLALAADLSAYPYTTAVGGQVVVTMTVTNRSSTTQNGIIGLNPSSSTCGTSYFPSWTGLSGGDVSCIGVPIYSSSTTYTNPLPTYLKNDMDASQTTAKVADTTNYPVSGTLLIGTELMDYTAVDTGANKFTGLSRGVSATTADTHARWSTVYSQDTSAFSLASGESATIKWVFEATDSGYVYFTARAQNGTTASATSKLETSNLVVIGDFTTLVEVSPLGVIDNQSVTVTMTVQNNGITTFTNVTPNLTAYGTATATLVTGPSPTSVTSLAPGETAQFVWEYTISGSTGDTYYFTGSAGADGPLTSASYTSETGQIINYAVSVTPTVLVSNSAETLTWSVGNNGTVPIKEIEIPIDASGTGCGSSDWVYASNTPPAQWTSSTVVDAGTGAVTSVIFTSDNPVGTKGILPGESKDFVISFTCVEQVTSPSPYNFGVDVTDQNNNVSTVQTEVTVTPYQLTLTAYDQDCQTTPPTTLTADGYSMYCFKAELEESGAAASGEPLHFTSTAGTLSTDSGITNSTGDVYFYLIAPCSDAAVTATVEARYLPETTDSAVVDFNAVATPTLRYVPNSLTFHRTSPSAGDIGSPGLSIDTGDVGYFSVDVAYCGPSAGSLTVHGCPDPPGPSACSTSLATADGSPDAFTLDSSTDITLDVSNPSTLDFLPGTISYGPIQCYPLLIVDADYSGTTYVGPYSSPGKTLFPDMVTVDLGTECNVSVNLQILDWREVY